MTDVLSNGETLRSMAINVIVRAAFDILRRSQVRTTRCCRLLKVPQRRYEQTSCREPHRASALLQAEY